MCNFTLICNKNYHIVGIQFQHDAQKSDETNELKQYEFIDSNNNKYTILICDQNREEGAPYALSKIVLATGKTVFRGCFIVGKRLPMNHPDRINPPTGIKVPYIIYPKEFVESLIGPMEFCQNKYNLPENQQATGRFCVIAFELGKPLCVYYKEHEIYNTKLLQIFDENSPSVSISSWFRSNGLYCREENLKNELQLEMTKWISQKLTNPCDLLTNMKIVASNPKMPNDIEHLPPSGKPISYELTVARNGIVPHIYNGKELTWGTDMSLCVVFVNEKMFVTETLWDKKCNETETFIVDKENQFIL